MINRIISLINQKYPLTEIDSGEFANINVNGMKFSISAYKAEGLGHVSVMNATGFFGLMKMDTLIINPTEIDLPLYSYDRIFAMGNDTLIIELYDTLLGDFSEDSLNEIKAKYSYIPEHDLGEHWYNSIKLKCSVSNKGKKTDTESLNQMALEYFISYLNTPANNAALEEKQKKARFYVDGLIEKGGPPTNAFKKSIGKDKTRELFEKILFGTE
jgi:hypothetical protein